MKTASLPRVFDEFTGEDHQLWKAHRLLTKAVPRDEVGYRGCLGMGLIAEDSGHWIEHREGQMLIPDADLSWLMIQDLPLGKWRHAKSEVHLATVRKTSMRYSMPTLTHANLVAMSDFRKFPFDKYQGADGVEVHGDDMTLNPAEFPQRMKVFNAIEMAMTSTAFHHRSGWSNKRKALYDALGLEYTKDSQKFVFGGDIYDRIDDPQVWMPKSFLAFPAAMKGKIFQRVTRPHGAQTESYYPYGLQIAALKDIDNRCPIIAPVDGVVVEIYTGKRWDALPVTNVVIKRGHELRTVPVRAEAVLTVKRGATVSRGDVLGHDIPVLPEGWLNSSLHKKWEKTLMRPKAGQAIPGLGRQLSQAWLALWFFRQALELVDGYVHFPAAISSEAAYGLADDDKLYWDVTGSLPYFNEAVDAFIFPTTRLWKWNDFRRRIGDEVDVDLMPRDARLTLGRSDLYAKGTLPAVVPVPAPVPPAKEEEATAVLGPYGACLELPPLAAVPAPTVLTEEGPVEVAPPPALPVEVQLQRVDKKEFRKQKKVKTGRVNSHPRESRTVFDTSELNGVRKVLEMPLVDVTKGDNPVVAEALAFEDDPSAMKYRRPYLPKTYTAVPDVADMTDEQWQRLLVARSAARAEAAKPVEEVKVSADFGIYDFI